MLAVDGSVVPNGNIITVGVGKQYSTISAGISAARDGDTVKVDAGTYTDDGAEINNRIILLGVGGIVHLFLSEKPCRLQRESVF